MCPRAGTAPQHLREGNADFRSSPTRPATPTLPSASGPSLHSSANTRVLELGFHNDCLDRNETAKTSRGTREQFLLGSAARVRALHEAGGV